MTKLIPPFINGCVTESASGREQDVFNPATGELPCVVLADEAEMNVAVAATQAAASAWAETAPLKRARILSKFKGALLSGNF